MPTPLLWIVLLALASFSATHSKADSGLDLVSGFDADRVGRAYPIRNDGDLGEAAKLLFRLKRVSPQAVSARRPAESADLQTGWLTQLEGSFTSATAYAVPAPLGDLLGIQTLRVVPLATPSGVKVDVLVDQLPAAIKSGDRLVVTGMVVQRDRAVAAINVVWKPADAGNASWRWLSSRGVNAADLAGLNDRHQRSLAGEDAGVFYAMLAASAGPPPRPPTTPVKPIDLLVDHQLLTGRYVRLSVETIQVTRVTVTDPLRQSQLGGDHYFQIDCVGELGQTTIRIEPADQGSDVGDGENKLDSGSADPAVFEDRYPISIVTRDLPGFLKAAARGGEEPAATVSEVSVKVQVDGFFFRLWSYQSDYMRRFGNAKQFGPLLIAADLKSLQAGSPGGPGVAIIGWVAAAAIGLAILVISWWHRRTTAVDDQVRRKRLATSELVTSELATSELANQQLTGRPFTNGHTPKTSPPRDLSS